MANPFLHSTPRSEYDLLAGKQLTPHWLEKPLVRLIGIRTKTDTGRLVENTKAREITLVKELGKLAS